MTLKTSIILCTYNEANYIEETILALKKNIILWKKSAMKIIKINVNIKKVEEKETIKSLNFIEIGYE